jgi:hypothetical protein
MNRPVRTDNRPEEPEDVIDALERIMEQAERRLEAQIDSIRANGCSESREAADAECTVARASAHRASADAGVYSSNTPPQSSKNIGAEDWFEVGLYVDWSAVWRKLSVELEEKKKLADIQNIPEEQITIESGGCRGIIDRAGARKGNKKKGPYYHYRISFDDMTILIDKRELGLGRAPNVCIRVTGEACIEFGAEAVYRKGLTFIEMLGAQIVLNKISRVDLCLDMPDVPIDEFEKAYHEERYITVAKKIDYQKGKGKNGGVTLYFGRPPLRCRIYDKRAEILARCSPSKLCAMVFRRWGDRMPDVATRVEFEMHREALAKRGIDSVEDYFLKRADLIHYLAHDWLRLTAVKVDRENKNQSKTPTLAHWLMVQNGFQEWTGTPRGLPLDPLPKERVSVTQLIKQIRGVGKRAGKDQGKTFANTEELLTYINEQVRRIAPIRPSDDDS